MSSYNLSASYGKQSVPVFKITKKGDHHSITDMVVQIMLEGNVEASWLTGENHQIVPTETQKNTCYALALKTEFTSIEEYANALGSDILRRHAHLTQVTLQIDSRKWERIHIHGKPHNHAFTSSPSPVVATCEVEVIRGSGTRYRSGMKDVKLMKTTQSGFDGFIRDEFTNLEPVGAGTKTPYRIMCTEMDASWAFAGLYDSYDFARTNEQIFTSLLENFAGPPDTGRFSKSLQETVYIMAIDVLDRFPLVDEVSLITPNIHFYRWDAEQFGLSNPNYVFQSTDCHTSASGRITTTVSRVNKSKL